MAAIARGTPVATNPAAKQLGRPTLTTLDAIAQSLAIGPISSVALMGAVVAQVSGAVAPLAMLIGLIGALGLGWVISLYARRYAGAGAIYDYVRHATSPTLGVFAAGIYFIGVLFLGGAGVYPAIGLMGASALQELLGVTLPWWAIALPLLLLIFVVNHIGTRISTRVQLTLTAMSALPLLLVALAIIVRGGAAGHTLQVFNPANTTPAALFNGIFFVVTMFIGFEASASLGEETADPRRSIPRAVLGTVLISAVFYLLSIYTSAIGFGVDNAAQWGADPTPLSSLAARYVGRQLAPLVDIAVVVDLLAVASGLMVTSARGWFALARQGLLPPALMRKSRFHTPLGGNLLVALVALLMIGALAFSGTDPMLGFTIAATAGSFLIELIYIGLVVVAIRFVRAEPGRWWRWPALLFALVTPLMGIYGTVISFQQWPTNLGVYSAVAGIAITLIWMFVLRVAYPKRLRGE